MSDARLKSLAERIERLMNERDGIQSDIRDIYAEAKSAGYVPKVLRKAITRKRMDADKRDEEDAILELYEGALSGPMRKAVSMAASGATARQIEAETGIDQATVARSVSLNKKSETEKTADLRNTPAGDGIEALTPDGQGAVAGILSETRSPAFYPSDSAADAPQTAEPVEPTGNEGWAGERNLSCGGRGVQTTGDNPAPHASRSQQGQATPGQPESLPKGGTDEGRQAGNVAKPEMDPGRPPRPSPPQDPASDATPCGCVDGEAAPVPPTSTSQADGVAAPPATPASTTGIGAGTVSPGDAMVCAPVPAGTSPANPGGSHDGRLTPEPEVARAVPPATDSPAGEGEGCGPGLIPAPTFTPLYEAPEPLIGQARTGDIAPARPGEVLDASEACPSTPPQPDDCSTGEEPMQHEVGAVASASERVARPLHIARPEEDLPIPPFLDRRHKARATG